MIRLLIVDDEPMVRFGIRNSIPWEKNGVEIAGEAENGRSALQLALRQKPDIILCDIVMPVEDGMTLIRNLKTQMPDVRIILITGHSTQSYMMEAIRSNVRDYLLKPATAEQILASVLKVKNEVEQARADSAEQQGRGSLFVENLALLRAHFMSDLLLGRLSAEKIADSVALLSLPVRDSRMALVLAQSATDDGWALVRQCLGLFAPFDPLAVRLPDTSIVACLLNVSGDFRVAALSARTQAFFRQSDALVGALVITEPVTQLSRLAALYPTAACALSRAFWYPRGQLLPVSSVPCAEVSGKEIQDLEYKLFDALQERDPGDIRRCAEHLMNRLIELKPDRATLDALLHRVEQTVNMICRAATLVPLPPVDRCTPQELRDGFIRLCCQPQSRQGSFGKGQVGRALRYMEQNYKEDLSLEGVAAQLYISPTYLSRLLNEKTSLGFYGWLHYFRIEKAKDLLVSTEMKHYEIAEAVGYNSYKTFSEHFQDSAGCTAGEYRQRVRGTPDSPVRKDENP